MAGHLLGFDVGSSSVKASIVEIAGGAVVATATSPDTELAIDAPQAGWAEQHPDLWWEHMRRA
ncbi:MAG: carbohydrate kinase, partial [Spirochaetaceae bacterium]|nr:carbohydrate kinase [Spirochaetaceae bacterium]